MLILLINLIPKTNNNINSKPLILFQNKINKIIQQFQIQNYLRRKNKNLKINLIKYYTKKNQWCKQLKLNKKKGKLNIQNIQKTLFYNLKNKNQKNNKVSNYKINQTKRKRKNLKFLKANNKLLTNFRHNSTDLKINNNNQQ